ncbi:MAG TPA: hypothetical protein DDW65_02895 [Firmicutes bacterium]|jgi:raffinose/stachyose/melibiose transport system substrate-binding protein|nr:hypothetical protein [Bacillota bacterium]
MKFKSSRRFFLVVMLLLVGIAGFAVVHGAPAVKEITFGITDPNLMPSPSMGKSPSNPFPHNAILKVIASWEKAHPGYKIKIVDLTKTITGDESEAEQANQFIAMIKGGTLPDIVDGRVNFVRVPEYWTNGTIIRMDDYLKKPTPYSKGVAWENTYKFIVKDDGQVPGISGRFTIPYRMYTVFWLYNVDLFKKYGWKVPQTHEDLLGLFKKAKRVGLDGGFVSASSPDRDHWMHNIYGQGLSMKLVKPWCSPEVAEKLQPALDLPQEYLVRAVQKGLLKWEKGGILAESARLVKEMSEYLPQGYMGMDNNQITAIFRKGRVPMMIDGTWDLPATMNDPAVKFQVGSFSFPVLTAKNTPLAGKAPIMPNQWADNQQGFYLMGSAKQHGVFTQAVDFAQFLTSPEVDNAICSPVLDLPAIKGAKEPVLFKNLTLKRVYMGKDDMEITPYLFLGPEYAKIYQDEWNKYSLGMQTLDQLIAKMQKALEEQANLVLQNNQKLEDKTLRWDTSKW